MAGPDPSSGELAERGHIFESTIQHSIEDDLIDLRVLDIELARGTEEHLAGFARLNVEGDGIATVAMGAFQVTELDDLMAHEAGIAIGYDEVSLAFAHAEARSERGRPWTGSIDASWGGDPRAFGESDTSFGQKSADGNSGLDLGSGALCFVQEETRSTRRIKDRVIRHPKSAGHSRTQIWFGLADLVGTEDFDPDAAFGIELELAADLGHFLFIRSEPKSAASIVLDVRREIGD